jgi:hypothetical protein
MKLWVGFAIFMWLLCGLVGEWRMHGAGNLHFKGIAKGPITLAKAFDENPVTYPGPS